MVKTPRMGLSSRGLKPAFVRFNLPVNFSTMEPGPQADSRILSIMTSEKALFGSSLLLLNELMQ